MRDDLDKAITESPRKGGGGKFPRRIKHKGKVDELDFVSIKTGIKKAYGTNAEIYNRNTKVFTDQLAPIYGLIKKNVGKNWDKLFSEMRKQFKPDSVVHQHIYEHLFQFIQIRTRKNGDVIEYNEGGRTRWRQKPWVPIDEHIEFYVHPVSKCIIKNKLYKTWRQASRERTKQRLDEKEKVKLVISENEEAHLIKDVWYLFIFDLTPVITYTERTTLGEDGPAIKTRTPYAQPVADLLDYSLNMSHMNVYGVMDEEHHFLNSHRSTELRGNKEIRHRYAKTKRQLNHQELKKYGLV